MGLKEERGRERERQTDGQTGGGTDRQGDRETDSLSFELRETHILMRQTLCPLSARVQGRQ